MITDIEVGLSDTERAIRDRAHQFAKDVMRPIGAQLDQLQAPGRHRLRFAALGRVQEVPRSRPLRHGVRDGRDVAVRTGPAPRHRQRGDGLGRLRVGHQPERLELPQDVRDDVRPQALVDRYVRSGKDEIGCWAVTEPDHGSDSLTVTEPHFRDPKIRANCIATRDGDDYIIRGQKSAWVSNGSIATVAALFCTIDPSQGFHGGGVAVVPLDLPGVSRGKPTDKLGQRALNQGEIFFDEVRIPAEYMVVGCEAYGAVVEQILTGANAGMGTCFVGVARAALEHALEYAKNRVQGGVPIMEHQSVKARIFKMFTQVEAARSLSRRVAHYNATNPPLLQYSIASKVFSTTTAFEVASQALQIFGGNGLTRAFPIEKLMRDARASMIEDGCNDILSLVGASRL